MFYVARVSCLVIPVPLVQKTFIVKHFLLSVTLFSIEFFCVSYGRRQIKF